MDEKKDGVELLREYAEGKKEKRFCPILHGHYGDVDGDCMRGTCAECEGGYLAALADRIGREREELGKRLMPEGMEWPPKDCEGEDLHIGEKAHFLRTGYDGDHEWDDVIVAFRHQGVEGEGDAWIVVGEEGEAFACDCAVERPAVLAADGLPIEVGQTVYHDGGMFEVQAVCKGAASDEFGEWYDSCLLTHTQPITQSGIDKYVDDALRCAALMMISEDAAKSLEDRVKEALRCQRELDAKTTGSE